MLLRQPTRVELVRFACVTRRIQSRLLVTKLSLVVFNTMQLTQKLDKIAHNFYPTAIKGCRGIVFTHGVRMGGWAVGKSLSGQYLRNCKM